MNVQDYLKQHGVPFEVIPHEQTFTAQEVAAAEHVTGHKFAKTVILKGDGDTFMFVLPASRHVDLKKAAEMAGTEVQMATEEEMKIAFPDCEIGAEPPFGTPYGVRTFVDTSLLDVGDIVFRAGTHDQTVKMKYDDYSKLEEPAAGSFATEE